MKKLFDKIISVALDIFFGTWIFAGFVVMAYAIVKLAVELFKLLF